MLRPRNFGTRFLCLVICAVCLLYCVVPALAVKTEPEANQTLTTVIRMRAKSDSAPIGQLENGTKVTVLGVAGGFYKVDCYDMIGYIAKVQVIENEAGEYYVNCQEGCSETKILTYVDHAEALELRHSLLSLAKKQIGSRYVYGGMRPGAFDCSGLTSYLYKQHGINLQRQASLQLQDGIVVPKEAMQVGDLVFFREGTKSPASHVGIYAGNGQIIHAGSSTGVVYSRLDMGYFERYFLCARRVINTSVVQQTQPMARTVTPSLIVNSVSGRSIS